MTRAHAVVATAVLVLGGGVFEASQAATPTTPEDAAAAVDVVRVGADEVIVNVRARVPVLAAARLLCEAVRATCTLPPANGSATVAPLRTRGTWVAVVNDLFKGAGLDFAASPARGETAPVLMVSDAAQGPPRAAATPQPALPTSLSTEVGASDESTEDLPTSDTPATPEPEAAASQTASEAPAAAEPLTAASTGGISAPQPMISTPFVAPDGKPLAVPAKTVPAAAGLTPFVTPEGKPIVVDPAPAPIFAPFVDPDGNPIQVTPTPGAVLGPPMAPNVGRQPQETH